MKYKKYTLQQLATIKYGKNQKKVLSENRGIPIYGTGGLMGYATKALYNQPSVLIGRKGTIGKVKYVDHPFWTIDTLFYTIVNEELVIPKYLYYVMSQIDLNIYNEGTTIPSLRTETLNRLEFDIPSLEEQREVLSCLEPLDEIIELNNAINNNLLEQAIMIFTDVIRGRDKNGCIGDYCTVKSGFAFKSSWWQDTGIRVVKIGSINQDNLDLNSCAFVSPNKVPFAKDFIVKSGDLLIAMTGATIGKFAMVPIIDEPVLVNQRVGKFFLGDNPIDNLPFIYCQLKQDEIYNEIINRGQGSAQPNVSATDILNVACVIPPVEEISKFNATVKPMFESIINNQSESLRLSLLRDTILPKLMSGELDVSDIEL